MIHCIRRAQGRAPTRVKRKRFHMGSELPPPTRTPTPFPFGVSLCPFTNGQTCFKCVNTPVDRLSVSAGYRQVTLAGVKARAQLLGGWASACPGLLAPMQTHWRARPVPAQLHKQLGSFCLCQRLSRRPGMCGRLWCAPCTIPWLSFPSPSLGRFPGWVAECVCHDFPPLQAEGLTAIPLPSLGLGCAVWGWSRTMPPQL